MENLLAIPFKCLEVPKADIEECVVLTIIYEKLQLTDVRGYFLKSRTFLIIVSSFTGAILPIALVFTGRAVMLKENKSFFVLFFSLISIGLAALIVGYYEIYNLIWMLKEPEYWDYYIEHAYFQPTLTILMLFTLASFSLNMVVSLTATKFWILSLRIPSFMLKQAP